MWDDHVDAMRDQVIVCAEDVNENANGAYLVEVRCARYLRTSKARYADQRVIEQKVSVEVVDLVSFAGVCPSIGCSVRAPC